MAQKNCLIINNHNSESKICYVFCSSNGLFWGSRDVKFVIENDYYEFINIAKDKRFSNYKKMIFLRDTDISFYTNGINEEINDITKLIEFVRKETIGLELIIVGVSAGGYLANLLGIFLSNAKIVYGFGTVFNIRQWHGRHAYNESKFLLENEKNPKRNQYYDLYPIFQKRLESSKTRFYYIYGSRNKLDLEIADETHRHISANNFVFIPIKSKEHGVRLSYNLYVSLLTTTKELKPRKKSLTKFSLELSVAGFNKTVYNFMLFLKYKFAKAFIKFTALKNKIYRYFQIKNAFKKARYLLENGYYCVDNRTIKKLDTDSKKPFYEKFRVHTKRKDASPVDHLYFTVTNYKRIFVSDEESYFYIKRRRRYVLFKQNYSDYGQKLPYNHISLKFIDKEKRVIGDTAKGVKYKNNEMFDEVIKLLFDVASKQETINKELFVRTKSTQVPFFIQHGDFKNSNVIWNNGNYCLIDLEEANEYPLFFDLLFFVLISKPKSFIDIIFKDNFITKIKSIWLNKDEKLHFDKDYIYVDYTLLIYLSFLLDKYKLEHTKEFFDYYLFWTSDRLVDDERLSLTKSVINSKLTRDRFFKKGMNK